MGVLWYSEELPLLASGIHRYINIFAAVLCLTLIYCIKHWFRDFKFSLQFEQNHYFNFIQYNFELGIAA